MFSANYCPKIKLRNTIQVAFKDEESCKSLFKLIIYVIGLPWDESECDEYVFSKYLLTQCLHSTYFLKVTIIKQCSLVMSGSWMSVTDRSSSLHFYFELSDRNPSTENGIHNCTKLLFELLVTPKASYLQNINMKLMDGNKKRQWIHFQP
jgi:hypothetical protein